jgi:DNA-binding MarR family transcriptional regulator
MARPTKALAILTLIEENLKLAPKLQLQGDKLTKDLGLTSSRWSFLGFVQSADGQLTIADLARRMDLKPQTVQRFANALSEMGFITLENNPDHKRANLIRLTARGKQALARLEERELDWVVTVASGLTATEVRKACKLLARFRENISRG